MKRNQSNTIEKVALSGLIGFIASDKINRAQKSILIQNDYIFDHGLVGSLTQSDLCSFTLYPFIRLGIGWV